MKIGVISDTHMPKKAKNLPKKLLEGLMDVDAIIHAGDWVTMDVYHQLKQIAQVNGVYGNVDSIEVQQYFKEKMVLEVNGHKIGIVHGHIGKKKTTPERALEAFQDEKVDVIIFGHSHIPYHKIHNDTILFNPGSPTDKRFQPQFSYGIIELKESIDIKHHFFDDKS